ncbi:hypothetical protein LCGC14_1169850 [marine sediment metagenome]|uniref:Uncharacterized protein n=1 Tax=marine sediment metagenome TaxID=412755 RepID=A0A0F9MD60_9ZZZZ
MKIPKMPNMLNKELDVRISIRSDVYNEGQEIVCVVEYARDKDSPHILIDAVGGPNIEFALLEAIKTLVDYFVAAGNDVQEACRFIEMALNAFRRNDAINWGELDEFLSMNYGNYKPEETEQVKEEGEGDKNGGE